jgi:hypothetical protein
VSTRCLVVARAQVCTTSSHPDPPGYAPSSDPLSPSSPPVETGRRGDPQKGNSYTLKLRKANLKYLAQLQALPEADLRVLGRQTDLGEGLLVALQRQLSPDYLQAQLSPEIWLLLHQEGVKTIWDVALLTPEHLEHIAKNQQMDVEILTRFHQKCQALVKRDQQ